LTLNGATLAVRSAHGRRIQGQRLEVQDCETGEWVAVPPNRDAYVVNMGDMISRITGGLDKRNKNLADRYSVVLFDGNLDYKLRRLDRAFGQDGDGNGDREVDETSADRSGTHGGAYNDHLQPSQEDVIASEGNVRETGRESKIVIFARHVSGRQQLLFLYHRLAEPCALFTS
ncbi:hypothetical protein V1515DRAFT_628962, partial [Lipomyces mesembrius]